MYRITPDRPESGRQSPTDLNGVIYRRLDLLFFAAGLRVVLLDRRSWVVLCVVLIKACAYTRVCPGGA